MALVIKQELTENEIRYAKGVADKLGEFYEARMIGQTELKRSLIVALLAEGHILIESVPGLAKTTAAKAISDAVAGKFSRIQCTPDLLPSDIVGTQIYNASTNSFETTLGPVFANFVLLDEINRSSAKTQSAMLETMQEKQVTIGGDTHHLPSDVFMVIATQNPIEQEGTYPLAEAQTDRFMFKETLFYPSAEEEVEIMSLVESQTSLSQQPVLSVANVDTAQKIVSKVFVDPAIKTYIASIVDITRSPDLYLPPDLRGYVKMGASPRASIAFMNAAKASAILQGRAFATPDDVKAFRYQVLRHRIALGYSAIADGVSVENIIDGLISRVPTP